MWTIWKIYVNWLDMHWIWRLIKPRERQTYKVPANLVLTWLWFSGRSLANPKSAILGMKSLSSNILLGFISRCMIHTWYWSCKYARPLAVPKIILNLCFQLSVPRLSPVGQAKCIYVVIGRKKNKIKFRIARIQIKVSLYQNLFFLTEDDEKGSEMFSFTHDQDLFLYLFNHHDYSTLTPSKVCL